MKKHFFSTILLGMLFLTMVKLSAQVAINTDSGSPDNSSMLDVKSTTKGFLLPRMSTEQRDEITSPAVGLMIFNLDCNDFQFFNGTNWVPLGNSGTVETPGSILGNSNPCINAVGETYSIAALPGAIGYNWTVPPGSTITEGQGTTSITVNFGTSDGAVFVSAYSACWRSLGSFLEIEFLPFPAAPASGVHIPSATQIDWKWNSVPGANGYKWSDVNDYSAAIDMAGSLTKTETGLECNTEYTRYVWSYNACGNSDATVLVQSTLSREWNMRNDFICGNNPSGAWSYGRKWSPQSTSFDLFTQLYNPCYWWFGNWGHGAPAVSLYSASLLNLWAKNNSNGLPTVRWTCPATGIYNLTSTFIGTDSRGVDNNVYITLNGVTLFTDHLQYYQDSTNFSSTNIQIDMNGRLDFVINWAGGVYSEYCWTGVKAIIEQVCNTSSSSAEVTKEFLAPLRIEGKPE